MAEHCFSRPFQELLNLLASAKFLVEAKLESVLELAVTVGVRGTDIHFTRAQKVKHFPVNVHEVGERDVVCKAKVRLEEHQVA